MLNYNLKLTCENQWLSRPGMKLKKKKTVFKTVHPVSLIGLWKFQFGQIILTSSLKKEPSKRGFQKQWTHDPGWNEGFIDSFKNIKISNKTNIVKRESSDSGP